MKVGIIGLGRMGASIAYRAHAAGFSVYGFDLDASLCHDAQKMGVQIAASSDELAQHVDVMWLMVPAGEIVDRVLQQLIPHVRQGTTIIDGGNSHFVDSQRRAALLAQHKIDFLDCGTSGGLHGRDIGFCLMVGGQKKVYDKVLPLLQAIAAPQGFGYMGPTGAGHYVKMVHNGIEYGLMQAYAEGFQILKEGSYQQVPLDLQEVTRVWQHGSIIRSWLLTLSHEIFTKDQNLQSISGAIEESGTGKWTVEEAHKHKIPAKVIEDALEIRAQSRATGGNFATKVVAMMRHAFGGHKIGKI